MFLRKSGVGSSTDSKISFYFPLKNTTGDFTLKNQEVYPFFVNYLEKLKLPFIINKFNMCFVKSLVYKKVQLESAFKPIESGKSSIMDEESTPCFSEENVDQQKMGLFSILQSLLVANSIALIEAEQKVNEVIQKIETVDQLVKTCDQPIEEILHKTQEVKNVDPLVEQVFGQKSYKYKLELEDSMPQVLYKERNFNFGIRLTDSSGRPVRNANLIPLCLGAITTTGEWIHENRMGETLLKGKSQVQLYKGKAEFLKMYLREVSRPYPNGKLNFIVYAKQSMMKYLNHTDLEEKVNQEDIMPLIIKDLSVRAKKK